MKRLLKWVGIGVGALTLLLAVAAVGLMLAGSARLNRSHAIDVESVTLPTDDEALARGAHLVNVFCRDCHGVDLGGQVMLDDPMLGVLPATNITGVAERYSDKDLTTAIRHGIAPDGRHLMLMPSDFFVHLSETDLGAIISYLKSVQRTETAVPERELRPVGRMLVGTGAMEMLFPATYTDHALAFPDMPQVAADASYGEYLAQGCQGCHGEGFMGRTMPGPGSPQAPNLTPAGALGDWTEDGFVAAMRTGITPDGRVLDPETMPWPSYAKLGDDELRALWIYFSALEPIE